jgi:DNA-binding MarR family transcriptional regulator
MTDLAAFTAAWERVARVMRLRRAQANAQRGLSESQYVLLAPLRGGGSVGIGELAAAAGIAGPTATRMLHQLQAAELVERRPDPGDSRRVLVTLTGAGAAAVRERGTVVEAGYRRVFESLDEHERHDLERLLQRFADVLEADAGVAARR